MILIVDGKKVVGIMRFSPKSIEESRVKTIKGAILVKDSDIVEDYDLYEHKEGSLSLRNGWEEVKSGREQAKIVKRIEAESVREAGQVKKGAIKAAKEALKAPRGNLSTKERLDLIETALGLN